MELTKTKYKQTEVGLIPEDWECSKMGDIGNTIIGLTYSPRDVSDYGTLVLRSSNVQNNRLVYQNNVFVQMDLPQRVIVKKNDILICVRNGSKHLIGKCALIDKKAEGMAFGAFMSIYRSQFSKFIFYAFQSSIIQRQIDETMGATINQLTNKNLAEFQIPLPPLPEQKAIAQVLSDTDTLIQTLEQKLVKKRAIKQGAMQQLLTPKKDWEVKKLGEIAEFYKGKGLPKSEIVEEGKYKCIHYGELFTKYNEEINDIISRTNIYENRFISKNNDVLMPTSDVTPNGLATASCIKEDNVILGGDVLVIRMNKDEVNGSFLSYFIAENKKEVMQLVTGSTVYHLYGSDMAKFTLTYPNVKEQTRIATILSDMNAEIAQLEQKLDKYKLLKQGLMQELLTGRIRLV